MRGSEFSETRRGGELIVIAVCGLAIILALVAGVGGVTGLVLRHLIQTAPLWVAVGCGLGRVRVTGWIALPSFLFWLALMIMIWLYLLGVARFVSGHFSPVEIAMTIVVGIASLIGIVSFWRSKSHLRPWSAIVLFVLFAAAQWGCFLLSITPRFATR